MKMCSGLMLLCLPALSLTLRGQGARDPAQVQASTGEAWPTYHGDYSGRHYSPLKQVTVANAKGLSLAWIYKTTSSAVGAITGGQSQGPTPPPVAGRGGGGGGATPGGPVIQSIPLMVNGVLYLSGTESCLRGRRALPANRFGTTSGRGATRLAIAALACTGTGWTLRHSSENSIVSLDAVDGEGAMEPPARRAHGRQTFPLPLRSIVRNHVLVGIGGDGGGSQSFLESLGFRKGGESQWKWLHHAPKGQAGQRDVAQRGSRAEERRSALATADIRFAAEPART